MKPLLETILSRKLHDPKVVIYDWLKKYGIENYTVNDKGEVDVDGNVNLAREKLTEFPSFIQFGTVKGDFICNYNLLTTLEGAPKKVGGNFLCYSNNLTTLEGAPREITGRFDCSYNDLTSLEGAPKKVGKSFYCYHNHLTTLKGSPEKVGGDFKCYENKLTTLKGAPREVGGWFDCSFNKTQFTKEDVKKVCNVLMYINV